MAITTKSKKETSLIKLQSNDIGPGYYEQLENKNPQHSFVPFMTSQNRFSKEISQNRLNESQQQPGPGDYQSMNLSFGTKNFNQNYPAFQSKIDRFYQKNKQIPGPGAYENAYIDLNLKSKQFQLKSENPKKKYPIFIIKNAPSIPNTNLGYEQTKEGCFIPRQKIENKKDQYTKDSNQATLKKSSVNVNLVP